MSLVSYSRDTYCASDTSRAGVFRWRPMVSHVTGSREATEPSEPVSDASLLRDLIAGSEEALAGLYDRHGKAVHAAAMRAGGDPWVAAEVVQETFLALWNRAELFDPSRGTLPAWLTAIARNRAIDRLRAAGRHDRAASFSSFVRTDADDHSVVEWLTATGELVGVAARSPLPRSRCPTRRREHRSRTPSCRWIRRSVA